MGKRQFARFKKKNRGQVPYSPPNLKPKLKPKPTSTLQNDPPTRPSITNLISQSTKARSLIARIISSSEFPDENKTALQPQFQPLLSEFTAVIKADEEEYQKEFSKRVAKKIMQQSDNNLSEFSSKSKSKCKSKSNHFSATSFTTLNKNDATIPELKDVETTDPQGRISFWHLQRGKKQPGPEFWDEESAPPTRDNSSSSEEEEEEEEEDVKQKTIRPCNRPQLNQGMDPSAILPSAPGVEGGDRRSGRKRKRNSRIEQTEWDKIPKTAAQMKFIHNKVADTVFKVGNIPPCINCGRNHNGRINKHTNDEFCKGRNLENVSKMQQQQQQQQQLMDVEEEKIYHLAKDSEKKIASGICGNCKITDNVYIHKLGKHCAGSCHEPNSSFRGSQFEQPNISTSSNDASDDEITKKDLSKSSSYVSSVSSTKPIGPDVSEEEWQSGVFDHLNRRKDSQNKHYLRPPSKYSNSILTKQISPMMMIRSPDTHTRTPKGKRDSRPDPCNDLHKEMCPSIDSYKRSISAKQVRRGEFGYGSESAARDKGLSKGWSIIRKDSLMFIFTPDRKTVYMTLRDARNACSSLSVSVGHSIAEETVVEEPVVEEPVVEEPVVEMEVEEPVVEMEVEEKVEEKVNQVVRKNESLPQNWQEIDGGGDIGVYFWNVVTHESTYTNPSLDPEKK